MAPDTAVLNYIDMSRKARQVSRSGYVLVIEDDMDIADLILKICHDHDVDAKVVFTIDEALRTLINDHSNIVMTVIDYVIDGKNADSIIQVCDNLSVPYIISTANNKMVRSKYPYVTVLEKPWHIETFLETIGVGHECSKTS